MKHVFPKLTNPIHPAVDGVPRIESRPLRLISALNLLLCVFGAANLCLPFSDLKFYFFYQKPLGDQEPGLIDFFDL